VIPATRKYGHDRTESCRDPSFDSPWLLTPQRKKEITSLSLQPRFYIGFVEEDGSHSNSDLFFFEKKNNVRTIINK